MEKLKMIKKKMKELIKLLDDPNVEVDAEFDKLFLRLRNRTRF